MKLADKGITIHNIWLTAKNGAKVSIAVGNDAYCTPREIDAESYTEIEAGFPEGDIPESWMPYCESPEKPHDTVYAYMPTHLLADWFIANKEK